MDRVEARARRGRPALLTGVLRHPDVWAEAVRAAWAVRPRRWWRRPPFLPLPDRRYVAWRVATAYGRADADVEPADVVAFLRWRAAVRRT